MKPQKATRDASIELYRVFFDALDLPIALVPVRIRAKQILGEWIDVGCVRLCIYKRLVRD